VILKHWNQSLAQKAVLPELLPALSEYVVSAKLKDDEVAALTRAISECAIPRDAGLQDGFYTTFKEYICTHFGWIRRLSETGANWTLVECGAKLVLPLPQPPLGDPERPWRALPGLEGLGDYAFADVEAPHLLNGEAQWDDELLSQIVQGVDREILKMGTELE